ncbi:NAD(P)H-dependent glycerol-3-phosphate dehydrogenase [Methyloceanibacter superfactus]|uniref:NAD(P)H-dependent glycerol-3-phosphate dehydrogenase n=1 Tax=Methyloceanibacter superfactus TaxID=1774969 RepID=UPI000B27DF32|nr:NAD(P)H-dependent glycerol-3-phosphate dehydrogenase [Methyloceanibacter superfactus]
MALQSVGVIGAGAWGTALAVIARRAGRDVLVWAREPETVAAINDAHRNDVFLPDIALDPAIEATSRLNEAATCDMLLMVTPAQHVGAIGAELAPICGRPAAGHLLQGHRAGDGRLLSQVAGDLMPAADIAVLSGPSFAADVASGLPAAVTLATGEEDLGRALSHALSHSPFRCYWSGDVIGAEIGGAVKNVYAIAAGIVVGKELGASAHAGLVTRGFAEMARFGVALGGRLRHHDRLSGLGDLVLTCGSPQSRNMSLGVALGQGQSAAEALSGRLTVTEGVTTASAMVEIASARRIELPIAEAVHAVISGLTTVDEAIEALLARPLRPEM